MILFKGKRYDDIVYYFTGSADRKDLKEVISRWRGGLSGPDLKEYDKATKELYSAIEAAYGAPTEAAYEKAFGRSEQAYDRIHDLGVKGMNLANARKRDANMNESDKEAMMLKAGYDPKFITFDEFVLIEKPWVEVPEDDLYDGPAKVYMGKTDAIKGMHDGPNGELYGTSPDGKVVKHVDPYVSVDSIKGSHNHTMPMTGNDYSRVESAKTAKRMKPNGSVDDLANGTNAIDDWSKL